jgi:hypothetical protein
MVKIELRDFAGNVLKKKMEFNQNIMSELDLLEKIDPAINTHAIYAIKHEYYNDRVRDGTAQNMDYNEMEQAKTEHLKSQYFKGRFGKILARFYTQKGEVVVPLSYDPTIPVNPSGLSGVQGDPRFTIHGANLPSWDSIKKLSAKELLFNEKLKGKKRKNLPKMDKPDFVKNLVLIYVPRVHSNLARWQHQGHRGHRHEHHYSPHPAEYNEDIRYEHQEISPPQLSPSPLPLPPPPPSMSDSPSGPLMPPPPPTAAKGKKSTRRKRKSKRRAKRRSRRSP